MSRLYRHAMKLAAQITDRTAKAALCRVLDERAQMGRDEVSAHGINADLLTLRKRIKELRGLLRLIRPGLPDAKQLDRQLRDVAKGLSPTRDQEAMLECLDMLTAGLRAPVQFSGLRGILLDAQAAHAPHDLVANQATYAKTLAEFQQRLRTLSLSDKASTLIWHNARMTYARAQQGRMHAEQAFNAGSDAEPFHDWRKSVKRHWYQARFLMAMRPDKIKKHISRIDRLGRTLGAHNDLDVLMHFLDAQTHLSAADSAARDILRRHVLSRRRSLARAALQEGLPALALPADDLITQWQHWWSLWRKGRDLAEIRD